jgi:hypothetical protein
MRGVLAGGLALVAVAFSANLALAAQEHLDAFRKECEAQNDPSLPCECFVDEAAARLNDNQQAYLYAQSIADQAEIDRLEDVMTEDEVAGTEEYMSTIMHYCP